MKVSNVDDRIHVLEAGVTPQQTLINICDSGVQEESFFVGDVDDIIRKFEEWNILMPRVHPHYAVKCNDNQTVLEVLAALGTGFDCASKVEMTKVMDLGVDPDRIIYANPAKMVSHIRHAAANGVRFTTFDSEAELYKFRDFYPTAKMVIRIQCDDENAVCKLGSKYGCDAVEEAPRLLSVAASLGLDVVGVSFHVGSGCRNPDIFREAITLAKKVFDVAVTIGYNFTLLDIGGGFIGNLAPFANVVNPALDELFPSPDVRVISEPGRYFVETAFTLAVNIHSRREIKSSDGEIIHVKYYINDGLYNSFLNFIWDIRVVRGEPIHAPRSKLYPSSVWGPTCDGVDKVETDSFLPLMELGTWMVYKEMGAYTLVIGSAFNGFPVARAHMFTSEAAWHLLKNRPPLSPHHFVRDNLQAKGVSKRVDPGSGQPQSVPRIPVPFGSGPSSPLTPPLGKANENVSVENIVPTSQCSSTVEKVVGIQETTLEGKQPTKLDNGTP